MHGMRLRRLGAGLVTTALVGAGNVLMPPNAWAAGVTLPVRVIKVHGEALVVAPVQIQGRTYPFVIDTGASKSSVDVHLARLLHLRRVGRPIHVLGVGGAGIEQVYRLPVWKLAGASLPPANVDGSHLIVGGFGPAGLVGSDILSRYGRVTIDYQHGSLTLGG